MQIQCRECKGKAIITTTNRMTCDFTRLYCSCRDAQCRHTFVMQLSYSHAIRPSEVKAQQQLLDQLRDLPPARLRELLEQGESLLLAPGQ